MRVYLNEFNIRMEKSAYLPIATGMLRAFSEAQPGIRENYEFLPFLYHLDSPANVLRKYEKPDVAAFSCWMWNEQLCLTVAKEIKERWPHCLIVFGGLHVPQTPDEYLSKYSFIDVAVRAEGESAFHNILKRNIESRDFSGIANVSWIDRGNFVKNTTEAHQPRDLDMYPSPYLEGLFDEIMDESPFQMQATIESNRGCPFNCQFCAWAWGGMGLKYRFHGVERVRKEIEWVAKNKIKYLFNADSNFGMHKRDEEIAQILVDTKTRYGYPEKFRTCFGKNADERIYAIAKRLHDADMEKGITLALQSNNPQVLRNIERQNIKMETYQYLQKKFNEASVPVYSELILGMPGETLETWKTGIEKLLKAGLQNQLFIYLCQILPNTGMAKPEYQERFGIITRRIELNEIHGAVRTPDLVPEYEEIIVTTDTMPLEMWKEMVVFSWMTMMLHSLKIGFFVLLYLSNRFGLSFTGFISYMTDPQGKGPLIQREIEEFKSQVERLLRGKGRGREMDGYSRIYWDEEEASFLRIAENLDEFYAEMSVCIKSYLMENRLNYVEDEINEVITYQRLRIPSLSGCKKTHVFRRNLPEYFEALMECRPSALMMGCQELSIESREYPDKPVFAFDTIMRGRKSGTIMNKAGWRDFR